MEPQMPDTPPSDYRAEQAEAGRAAADARIEELIKALLRVDSLLFRGHVLVARDVIRDAIADARAVVAGKGR
jgi:hypothetical protein